MPRLSASPFFEKKDYNDVVGDADKCSDEIVEELYFDNRLKLLNLRDCKKETEGSL